MAAFIDLVRGCLLPGVACLNEFTKGVWGNSFENNCQNMGKTTMLPRLSWVNCSIPALDFEGSDSGPFGVGYDSFEEVCQVILWKW